MPNENAPKVRLVLELDQADVKAQAKKAQEQLAQSYQGTKGAQSVVPGGGTLNKAIQGSFTQNAFSTGIGAAVGSSIAGAQAANNASNNEESIAARPQGGGQSKQRGPGFIRTMLDRIKTPFSRIFAKPKKSDAASTTAVIAAGMDDTNKANTGKSVNIPKLAGEVVKALPQSVRRPLQWALNLAKKHPIVSGMGAVTGIGGLLSSSAGWMAGYSGAVAMAEISKDIAKERLKYAIANNWLTGGVVRAWDTAWEGIYGGAADLLQGRFTVDALGTLIGVSAAGGPATWPLIPFIIGGMLISNMTGGGADTYWTNMGVGTAYGAGVPGGPGKMPGPLHRARLAGGISRPSVSLRVQQQYIDEQHIFMELERLRDQIYNAMNERRSETTMLLQSIQSRNILQMM